jgi:hypothetical protein
MGKKIFHLMKSKFKVGDTVSLFLSDRHLVSGIVYICSSIPMGKFYANQFGKCSFVAEDVYEDALVLIDNKKPGTLTVLTLEDNDNKIFTWNDVFGTEKADYQTLSHIDSLRVNYEKSLLTEMTHSFK